VVTREEDKGIDIAHVLGWDAIASCDSVAYMGD